MKAVAVTRLADGEGGLHFEDVEFPRPVPIGRELLVAVRAVGVCPGGAALAEDSIEAPGWGLSGQVVEVGPEVSLYAVGDVVCYASSVMDEGVLPEFHRVDELRVGFKPDSCSHAQAASLPAVAPWVDRLFFEHMGIDRDGARVGDTFLITDAASPVGAMAVQWAKRLGFAVVAATTLDTAEARAFLHLLGADIVVPEVDLARAVRASGVQQVDVLVHLGAREPSAVLRDLVRADGHISVIPNALYLDRGRDGGPAVVAPDELCYLLNDLAFEVDGGHLRAITTEVLQPMNAHNVQRAWRRMAAGHHPGQIVVQAWDRPSDNKKQP